MALGHPVLADVVAREVQCCLVAPNTARHLCSFAGETEVLMADGTTKPIFEVEVEVEVEVGDWVLTEDPETGERGAREVTQLWVQHGGQGNLPVISGNVATRNALATDLLDDILTAPGTRIVTNQGGNFAGGRTFIDPLGRGAVYDADGVFQNFGTFS